MQSMQFLRINNAYIKYRSYKIYHKKTLLPKYHPWTSSPETKQNKNEGKQKKKFINTNNK